MSMRTALRLIFVVSLGGLGFSGVLTYQELWGAAAASCPAPGAAGTLLGYPACVYGFFMYLLITILSVCGLRAKA
jgi:uncharacterized membrane protein